MKRSLLAIAFAGALTLAANAQETLVPVNRCASNEVYQRMLKNDPAFAKSRQSIEQFTEKFATTGSATMRAEAGTALYVIPVVVHVVYNTSTQNISDAQIQSQIAVLNKDFQKLNPDVSKVPSVWTSLVADCQVQFCLATLDPSGNPTTA